MSDFGRAIPVFSERFLQADAREEKEREKGKEEKDGKRKIEASARKKQNAPFSDFFEASSRKKGKRKKEKGSNMKR